MDKKIQATLPGGHRTTITPLHQRLNRSINVTQILFGISVLALAGLLSACSPSTSTPGTPTPTTVIASINLPVPTATPAPTSLQKQAAAPPAIDPLDPCLLIDSQEASAYAGSTFGAGEESTTPDGGGKICTYGSETANVFMVEVAQAPDVATAQADKADFLAMLQAKAQELASGGLNVTELPNFADGATMGQLSLSVKGIPINGSAIGVLKGTIFFGFSDVVKGGAAPSAAAVQAEATTLLGRLP
jgi:hypothetical protein